ncbi:putative cytochrome P450 monooxygenase [Patellaria atrata CBS 101060]|uniref:Cytochrome P450 monooxygenase n=1 Tax=Patellaria atrata CBS 101060 TaxID=1346257 RepID=A0A9P4VMM2_9PEZI|nr:putative cytochrome P450 monooxygenase [Patellaria atrata CBS 101060]
MQQLPLYEAEFGYIKFFISLVCLRLIWCITYELLLSPLRNIPGSLLARLSAKHSILKRVFGNGPKLVQADYEAYGDIYVHKPNGVSISDPKDIRAILGSQEFRKTAIYKTLDILERPSVFTNTDPLQASRRRRQINPYLNHGYLGRMEPTIIRYSIIAIKAKWERLLQQSSSESVIINYRNDTQYATFDTIGALAFGREFNSLVNDDPLIIRWIEATGLYLGLTKNFSILNIYPFSLLISRHKKLFEEFINYSKESVNQRKEALARKGSGEVQEEKPIDLLQAFIDAEDPESKIKMNHHEVQTESIAMQLAGSESTSFVTSWVIHLLTLYPQHLNLAVQEARQFPSDQLICFRHRTELPYLEACIYETLRYSPITSGFMPRVSHSKGINIQGYYIPSGVEVAINLIGVHANPKIWRSPHLFDPSRFLEDEEAKRNVFAFSYGHRNCIGRNLAWVEMLIIIANILKDFDISLPEDSVYGPHNVDELGRPRIMATRSSLFTTPKYPERDCRLVIKKRAV